MVIGAAILCFIREPERGAMSKEKDECNQTVDFYEEEDLDGEKMDTE